MRPEDRLQSHCRSYLDDALPRPGWWSALKHEKKQSLKAGQVQKALGVKRGLPDIAVWYLTRFIGVELKVGRNTTSDAQDGFAEAMRENGFDYVVVRSVLELHEALCHRGVPILPSMRIAALNHDAALALPASGPKPRRMGARKAGPPKRVSAAHAAASARWNAPRS